MPPLLNYLRSAVWTAIPEIESGTATLRPIERAVLEYLQVKLMGKLRWDLKVEKDGQVVALIAVVETEVVEVAVY
jgi:hypothetical protein